MWIVKRLSQRTLDEEFAGPFEALEAATAWMANDADKTLADIKTRDDNEWRIDSDASEICFELTYDEFNRGYLWEAFELICP